ncbi:hypothetical protein BHM03_00015995 [Ensete ventricosum]|nr:hypothetical protein BHM03_00015995 [Ensete ventricosum]
MSDDIVMQLSSSSSPSDPSLPTKLAKLEARMAGKSSSSLTIQSAWQPAPPPPIKFVEQEELPDSSSSDDDVSPRPTDSCYFSACWKSNGGEFLIQHNTQKRHRLEEDDHDMDLEQSKETNGRIKTLENFEIRRNLDDPNKKKQGRGRGRPSMGRGRGSKASDQMRSVSTASINSSNGQLENPPNKENWSNVPLGNDERVALQIRLFWKRYKLFDVLAGYPGFVIFEDGINSAANIFKQELKELRERDQQSKTKVRLTGPYRCTEFISVPVRYPIPSVHWNKATRDEASPRLVRSMRGRRCRLVLRRNEGSRHLVRSATSRRETSDLMVPLGSGRSAYQYPVGPVCTACTGRELNFSLKLYASLLVEIMQRIKVLSDLLISVSKAERQEARMKIRQESLRLGNIGVVR